MATIKGQNLRILIGSSVANLRCLAAAQSCTAHVSLMLEDAATKSDGDEWTRNEPVGIAWDVECNALVVTDDSSAVIASWLTVGQTYTVRFSKTGGSHNRTQEADRLQLTGKAILTDLTINSTVQDESTYTAKFIGDGELTQYSPT